MEAKRQPAEYPEPQIVNRPILHTGRLEDADQQGRPGYGYYALSEKLKDSFFSLDAQTTYHIAGRSFVVQPVFKPENNNTLGEVLLRLMQADCEKSL